MTYSNEDIIEKVREALKTPATLYNCDFVNYIGNVGDERYTEIVAREISKIQNFPLLCDIPQLTRQKSYKTESHKKLAKQKRPENSNRDEEWIAIKMCGKKFKYIGKILDFQTPLKDVKDDVAGKIDLLSYNKSENTAYILELKRPDSNETLLRCVLEAYTYWKIVDKERLLRDFDIQGTELRKAVLVFKECNAYNDFQDEKCCATHRLMGKLGVDLFVLDEDAGEVIESFKY